jgi:hypothetical protein
VAVQRHRCQINSTCVALLTRLSDVLFTHVQGTPSKQLAAEAMDHIKNSETLATDMSAYDHLAQLTLFRVRIMRCMLAAEPKDTRHCHHTPLLQLAALLNSARDGCKVQLSQSGWVPSASPHPSNVRLAQVIAAKAWVQLHIAHSRLTDHVQIMGAKRPAYPTVPGAGDSSAIDRFLDSTVDDNSQQGTCALAESAACLAYEAQTYAISNREVLESQSVHFQAIICACDAEESAFEHKLQQLRMFEVNGDTGTLQSVNIDVESIEAVVKSADTAADGSGQGTSAHVEQTEHEVGATTSMPDDADATANPVHGKDEGAVQHLASDKSNTGEARIRERRLVAQIGLQSVLNSAISVSDWKAAQEIAVHLVRISVLLGDSRTAAYALLLWRDALSEQAYNRSVDTAAAGQKAWALELLYNNACPQATRLPEHGHCDEGPVRASSDFTPIVDEALKALGENIVVIIAQLGHGDDDALHTAAFWVAAEQEVQAVHASIDLAPAKVQALLRQGMKWRHQDVCDKDENVASLQQVWSSLMDDTNALLQPLLESMQAARQTQHEQNGVENAKDGQGANVQPVQGQHVCICADERLSILPLHALPCWQTAASVTLNLSLRQLAKQCNQTGEHSLSGTACQYTHEVGADVNASLVTGLGLDWKPSQLSWSDSDSSTSPSEQAASLTSSSYLFCSSEPFAKRVDPALIAGVGPRTSKLCIIADQLIVSREASSDGNRSGTKSQEWSVSQAVLDSSTTQEQLLCAGVSSCVLSQWRCTAADSLRLLAQMLQSSVSGQSLSVAWQTIRLKAMADGMSPRIANCFAVCGAPSFRLAGPVLKGKKK